MIFFIVVKRPAPLGVRGSEVGIPALSFGYARSSETVDAKSISSICTPFHKARQAGLQNAAHFSKCFIMHEKASR